MTKEQFIKLMEEYLKLEHEVDQLDKNLKILSPDFGGLKLERHGQLFLDTIKIAMDDHFDWISYWLFELDEGRNPHGLGVTEENGKPIPMKTLADLYDCVKNHDEK